MSVVTTTLCSLVLFRGSSFYDSFCILLCIWCVVVVMLCLVCISVFLKHLARSKHADLLLIQPDLENTSKFQRLLMLCSTEVHIYF